MMKRKTNEEFLKEVYDLVGNEYTFLEEYKTNKTKIKVKHNVCGNIYEVTPDSFLHGKRCPQCFGNTKKTTEQFKSEVYSLVGDEYSVLSEYKNTKTKVKVKHNVCGNTYEVSPDSFLHGSRCPKCSYEKRNKAKRKTTEQFKEELNKLYGDEYSVLSEYKNNKTKIKVKHNKCNCEYETSPIILLKKHGCPYCYQKGSSHGNEYIAKYLDVHDIKYSREHRFEDCVYKRPLPFDFYLKEYNLTIEYDGEQHYSPNDFFEGHDPFKERQIKDKIKSKYCFEHNIKLLRIPYTDFNRIDIILNKELTALD